MLRTDGRGVVFTAVIGACSALGPAFAQPLTDPNDPRTWQGAGVGTFAQLYFGSNTAQTRQQVIDQHLLDAGTFNVNAPGFHAGSYRPEYSLPDGGAVGQSLLGGGYGYVIGSPLGYTGAANAIDWHWVQDLGDGGTRGNVWDLGGAANQVAVFPIIDHGPLPQEAIEYSVYLTNNPASTVIGTDGTTQWVQAQIVRVYLEGWNLPEIADGFTTVWQLPGAQTFRYTLVVAGGPGSLIHDGDDEIDGVAGLSVEGNPVAPDLRVESITMSSDARPGVPAAVSYTVRNAGDADAASAWIDRIYVSTDPVLDETDVLAATVNQGAPLVAGQTRPSGAQVTMPELNGTYYVLVQSDAMGTVNEGNNEGNNTGASGPVRVIPFVDLVVSSISGPAQTVLGQTIAVDWTISNTGPDTVSGAWNDTVSLSGDVVPGGDVVLGSLAFSGSIAPGASVVRHLEAAVPSGAAGNRYLVVEADAGAQIIEVGAEANNAAVDDAPILVTAPDLRATALSGPTSARFGDIVTVSFSVQNFGDGTASGPWTDALYLSTNQTVGGGDTQLAAPPSPGVLAPGGTYERSLQVALPANYSASGTFCLLARADNGANIPESVENNNVTVAAVELQPTLAVDLLVSSVGAPAETPDGQPAPLTWTVRNAGGAGATGTWVDRVYLSLDSALDAGDTLVGQFTRPATLAAGASYTQSGAVPIAAGLNGPHRFIVQTDATGTQPEPGAGGEGNNTAASDPATDIVQASLPDLFPTDLVSTEIRYTNQQVTLTWRVRNAGPGTANGSWTDRVYLSIDEGLDPAFDAQVFQRAVSTILPPGGEYLDSATFTLPSAPALYRVFVATDAGGQVYEADEGNNTASVIGSAVGPEYTCTLSASLETGVSGTPVTLFGHAARVGSNEPAPDADVDIFVRVRGTERVFRARTNSLGDYGYIFFPLPMEAGLYAVGAHHPAVVSASPQDQFTLYGMSADPRATAVSVTVGETVAGQLVLHNLGDTPLTGIATTAPGLAGNLQIDVDAPSAVPSLGSATVNFTLSATDATIPDSSVAIAFASAEGATASFTLHVFVTPPSPAISVEPATLSQSMLRAARTYVQFAVRNDGGAPSGDLNVLLPNAPWLRLATPAVLPPIDPGQSASVTLELNPSASLPLGPYSGSIVVSGEGGMGVSVPFVFTAISDARADLEVHATDEFTYFAAGQPRVEGALVSILDASTGAPVAQQTTAADGSVVFPELPEAYYDIEVTAPRHGRFRTTVLHPGGGPQSLEAFMPRETVSYTWTVVPTTFEDRYEVTIEAVFETNVPAPVVTIEPAFVDLTLLPCDSTINFTVTNHGLITAENVALTLGNHPRYALDGLVTEVGDLPAMTSVVLPVRVRDLVRCPEGGGSGGDGLRGGGSYPGDCVDVFLQIRWEVVCGIPRPYATGVTFRRHPGGTCGGGGCCGGGPGGGGPGGPGGPIVVGPVYSTPTFCDECTENCVRQALTCGIGLIPNPFIRCGLTLLLNCAAGPEGDGLLGFLQELKCVIDATKQCMNPASPLECLCELAFTCACCPTLCSKGDIEAQLRCRLVNLLGGRGLGEGMLCDPDGSAPAQCILNGGGGPGTGGGGGRGGGDGGTVDPNWAYYDLHAGRLLDYIGLQYVIFGDLDWVDVPQAEAEALREWVEAFRIRVEESGDGGGFISDAERDELLNLPAPAIITGAHRNLFLDRWNRSLTYIDAGIHSEADLGPGMNPDFISQELLRNAVENARRAGVADTQDGFDDMLAGYVEASGVLMADRTEQNEGVCARVRIRISQEAVITRDAFRATLTLENSGLSESLTSIGVDVRVEDASGSEVTSLFGIYPPEVDGLGSVDGTGSLGPQSEGSASWLIVPTNLAAPVEPVVYYVSGTLRYTLGGEEITIPLFPAPITVLPNADITLKYFLEKVAYSDDPFTLDVVEPAVPFSLGLLAVNDGAGIARNFRITSAQPEIVENDRGLLIDFNIIGTQVGLNQVSPSLTAAFGDLLPQNTAVARWLMTASLQGEFVEYSATFRHLNGLGIDGLSLIDDVEIHEMNHVVRAVDAPDYVDDLLPDFLANDTPDVEDLPDRVHLSSGGAAQPVEAVTDGGTTGTPTPGAPTVGLYAGEGHAGFFYVRVEDPSLAQMRLASVVRSDGKVLIPGFNFWQTRRIVRLQGQPERLEALVHLFDRDGAGEGAGLYALTFAPIGPTSTDSDGDGTPDSQDGCVHDPNKTEPGACGCGIADADTDGDGALNCNDGCPNDANKTSPGSCGCGVVDTDLDSDGTPDCEDGCPGDANKTAPGVCGCGNADVDTDHDGVLDCLDGCPSDASKTSPGACGCNVADADLDYDQVPDCVDNCPGLYNPGQADTDHDGVGNLCQCPCEFDGQQGVDSQDYFEFIGAFFVGNADINGYDGTDSQDYFDFVECFIAGCP